MPGSFICAEVIEGHSLIKGARRTLGLGMSHPPRSRKGGHEKKSEFHFCDTCKLTIPIRVGRETYKVKKKKKTLKNYLELVKPIGPRRDKCKPPNINISKTRGTCGILAGGKCH